MKRLLTALTLTVLLASANSLAQTLEQRLVVPAGATARLALRTLINSKISEAGDRVKAVLDEDVLDADGRVAIPAGTEFIGRITQVKEARRLHRQGSMTIVFETMRMPHGAEKISAVVTSIYDYATDRKLKARNGQGKVEGGRSATRLGRNAATGGAVGGLLGFVALISRAGYNSFPIGLDSGIFLGGVLTKGNEVRLGDETILRIRFEQAVSLPEPVVK
ncbi:MAG: hypothetical protein ACREEM_12300 [Blastocatellia bacterium]